MSPYPFALVTPATRGLSLAITRHLLRYTDLPVFATYRHGTDNSVYSQITSTLGDTRIDSSRLTLLRLDLMSEDSIQQAAHNLREHLASRSNVGDAYLHTGFFTGGILHPERQPSDLDLDQMQATFHINTLSHLLLIKHFSPFLPSRSLATNSKSLRETPSKWVHISARVGSISDNQLGGWYTYRASKAALNQVVKTFDLHLQARRMPAFAVAMHPGTVKTDFSREFWPGVKEGKLFEPEYAAGRIFEVVKGLSENQRGRVWDWKGEEVPP
jgi:NAD(P)-dependent dehydrogenase (short-subunit alcohol dehydrogenase family)